MTQKVSFYNIVILSKNINSYILGAKIQIFDRKVIKKKKSFKHKNFKWDFFYAQCKKVTRWLFDLYLGLFIDRYIPGFFVLKHRSDDKRPGMAFFAYCRVTQFFQI